MSLSNSPAVGHPLTSAPKRQSPDIAPRINVTAMCLFPETARLIADFELSRPNRAVLTVTFGLLGAAEISAVYSRCGVRRG